MQALEKLLRTWEIAAIARSSSVGLDMSTPSMLEDGGNATMEVCVGQRDAGMEVEAVSGQATDMPSSLTATRRSNASDRTLLAKHAPGPVS